MPSGPRKRKALKKPKAVEPASSPRGDVRELEPEFLAEDSIAKEREGTDEGLGADDGAELIGETSQREEGEVEEVEEPYPPTPHRPKAHTGDLKEQTELQEPPFTAAESEMNDAECEMEGETHADLPQRDPSPFTVNQNNISHDEITPVCSSPCGDIQSRLEHDADICDAPPIDSERAPGEWRSEPFKSPCENKLEHDKSSVRELPTTDLTSEDTGPSIDTNTHGETFPDGEAVPGKIEQGVEVKAELPDTHSLGVRSGAEEQEFEPQGALTSKEPNLDSSPVKEKMTQENMGQSIGDITPKSEALAAETKLDIGQDLPPTDLDPGSGQSVSLPSLNALHCNEPEFDEPSAKEEAIAGMIQENMGPNIDTVSSDDTSSDSEALYKGIQPGVEPDMEHSDAPPSDIKQAHARGSVQFAAQDSNESKPAELSMEEVFVTGMAKEVTGPALEDGQPQNIESTDAQEREICVASANVEPEAGPETDVTAFDRERGAVSENPQPEIDNELGSGETDTILASIESEATHSADAETLVMTDKDFSGTQSGMCQDTDSRKLRTDVFKTDSCEIEPRKIYTEADTVNRSEPEEPGVRGTESEIGASRGEIEANMEVPLNDVEVEQVLFVREGESESDASLGDFKCKIDPRIKEAEAKTKPDENALLFDAQEDKVAEVFTEPELQEIASQEVVPDMILHNVQSSLEAGAESGPDRLEDVVHRGIGPKSEEMKTGEVDAGNNGSFEPSDIGCSKDDINERTESSGDVGIKSKEMIRKQFETADGTDQVNEAPSEPLDINDSNDRVDVSISDAEPQGEMPRMGPEAGMEVSVVGSGFEFPLDTELRQEGSYKMELGQQDGQDQQDEAQQRQRGINSVIESPEVPANDEKGQISDAVPETVVESSEIEPRVQDLSAIKLDKNSPFNFDSNQQVVLGAELNYQNKYPQAWQEERQTDLVAEASGVCASEANQELVLPAPATAEAAYTSSAARGDALAIAGSGLPVENQEMLGDYDETDVAGTCTSQNDKRCSFDDEQSGELNEKSVWQHGVDTDDIFVKENHSAGHTSRGIEPREQEQDSEIEQPSATLVDDDKVALAEEMHAAEIKGSQATFDEQELIKHPKTFDVQSEKVEEVASTTSPPKSKSIEDESEPKNWIAFEQERRFSPSGIVKKDIAEEQAALSTAAEAGSSITDLDETPYYQQFSTDFTNSEHDADTSESRESTEVLAFDSSPPRSPFLNETVSTEQADGERSDGHGHYRKEYCLKEEFKAAQDLEPIAAQEEVAPKTRVTREAPAEVHISEEGNASEEGPNMEAGGREKHRQGAVPANLGDISKGNFDTVELTLSNLKAMHAIGVPVGEVPSNTSDGGPVQAASGQGMNGREAFYKQKMGEASLRIKPPFHEVKQRALNEGNLEANEGPAREGTVEGRSNLSGCCGMFDLLLGKS